MMQHSIAFSSAKRLRRDERRSSCQSDSRAIHTMYTLEEIWYTAPHCFHCCYQYSATAVLPGRGTGAACIAAPDTGNGSRGCRETGRRPSPTAGRCSIRSAAAGPSCCRRGSSWTPVLAWCSLRCRLAPAFGPSASVHTGKTARCETVDSTASYTNSCRHVAPTLRHQHRRHSASVRQTLDVIYACTLLTTVFILNTNIMNHQHIISVRTWMLSPQVCRVRQISSWNSSISVKFGRCGSRS
jgi:hypothetical protein